MVCLWSVSLYVGIIAILYKLIDYVIRLPRMGSMHQRYVLITGCDSGFGFDAVKRLDKEGCYVFATCITEQGEALLKKSCSSRLQVIRMNITDSEAVKKGFEVVKAALPFGKGLWGLVNNAGVPSSATGPCEMMTLDNYRECYNVNVLGMVDVTMTFLPLIKRGQGRIVNTASMGGRIVPLPFHAPYNVSKYAVEAFCDVLRRNVVWYGIGVHIIEPMMYPTNMAQLSAKEQQIHKAWTQSSAYVKKEYGEDYEQTLIEWARSYANKNVTNSLDDVIDAYHHALFAYYPRARYQVGKGANLFVLLQALPECLSDYLLGRAINAPRPASAFQL